MKFSELPIGTVVKNKHGVFRKLPDSRKGAGRAEALTHDAVESHKEASIRLGVLL